MRVFKDPAEAQAIFEYDKMVDHDKTETLEHDLTPEQKKIAQKNCHAGVRNVTAYKWGKKERKPNATKSGIIAELAEILQENSSFMLENFQIPNKEGKISFTIGGKWYTLALTEHRTKPKWVDG